MSVRWMPRAHRLLTRTDLRGCDPNLHLKMHSECEHLEAQDWPTVQRVVIDMCLDWTGKAKATTVSMLDPRGGSF